MMRMRFSLLLPLLGLGFLLALPAPAEEVTVTAQPDQPQRSAQAPTIGVTFRSSAPGFLYKLGQPIDLVARLANSDPKQKATVTLLISTGMGAPVLLKETEYELPEKDALEIPIFPDGPARLRNGPYQIEISVAGEKGIGYGSTLIGLWDGPADKVCDRFGISYAGPLDGDRVLHDLDLFKLAGIGWLRFPLRGWLPQGDVQPPEAEVYRRLIDEAKKRDFQMLAAFTPRVTVDPAINPLQADKEYRESLLAAASHFGSIVKQWELLRVKSDPAYPELKGIGFPQLTRGRESLKAYDKTLQAVYGMEDPFKWNAIELYGLGHPLQGDAIGLHYNFIGLPEMKTNPSSPLFSIMELQSDAKGNLKRIPPFMVTEYGFDPAKGDRLPKPVHQAALISRALLLDSGFGFTRIFWRHLPDSEFDLPITNTDGSVEPSLLALRTTLSRLADATEITEVPSPVGYVRVFQIRYGEKKKGKAKPRYALVAWSEKAPAALSIKTKASTFTVTDIWGNSLDISPTANIALFSVDEFPRFIDLGEVGEFELFQPFAVFDPPVMTLRKDVDNTMGLVIHNDQRLFNAKITCEVNFRRWPGEGDVKTKKVTLDIADRSTITDILPVPPNVRKGMVYEVNVDIMVGTRRLGYLVMPVNYLPVEAEK